MGWLDKLMGRGKQTAGAETGSEEMMDEGRHQEAAGEAEDNATQHEEMAQAERERAAEHRAEENT